MVAGRAKRLLVSGIAAAAALALPASASACGLDAYLSEAELASGKYTESPPPWGGPAGTPHEHGGASAEGRAAAGEGSSMRERIERMHTDNTWMHERVEQMRAEQAQPDPKAGPDTALLAALVLAFVSGSVLLGLRVLSRRRRRRALPEDPELAAAFAEAVAEHRAASLAGASDPRAGKPAARSLDTA